MLNYLKQKEAGIAVFKRENGIFLHPEDKTDVDVWIGNGPCIVIPLEVENRHLGELVRENLTKNRTNISHPNEFKGMFNFVIKKAGVRSYKQFMSGCRHCSIHQKGKKLIFTHSVNEGSKGFSYTSESIIEIDLNSSDENIGKTTIECLDKSK